MPHYIYLNHTRDDYDANRKGMLSEEQFKQLHDILLENSLKQRNVVFGIGIVICILLLLQSFSLGALAIVLFLIQASFLYPTLIRYRLDKLQHLDFERIDGRVRLMNKDLRKADDLLFIQLRHHEIDLNFDVSGDEVKHYNEADTYRFYYRESPPVILSAQAVDTLSEMDNERKTHETL